MKALEKDRTRRYETANGLAMDIQRHLNSEPVVASPPGNLYRFQKMVRRHKLAFIVLSVVIASLIFGFGVATVAALRIQRDNRQIRKAKDDATEKLWGSYLAEARATRASHREGQRFDSLEAVRQAAAIRTDLKVRNEAIACLAMSDLRVSREAIFKVSAPDILLWNNLVRYDFDLEKYVVGETNGSLTVHAVADDRVLAVLPAPGFRVGGIRIFSPNSRFLRVLYKGEGEKYSDWVWDLELQKAVLKELPCGMPIGLPGDLAGNLAGDFSSDSRLFTRCQLDGTLSVYDLGSGKEIKRLPGTRIFNHLILNPGHTRIACCSEADSTVEIREVESGRKATSLTCPGGVSVIAWSPDGKRLATACLDNRIYTWDAVAGERKAVFEGHYALIGSLAFNHAGNLLASTSWDGVVRLWDAESGRQVASHPGYSWLLQFSPDDRQLLGWENMAHHGSLEVADGHESRLLHAPREGSDTSGPEFSADGQMLAAGTGERVRFWDASSGKEIGSLPLKNCNAHIFQPDGHCLIVIDVNGGVGLRSLERTGDPASLIYRLKKPRRFYEAEGYGEAGLSGDGRHLAVTHESEGESFVFDLQEPSAKPVPLRPHPRADRIAISPDGHWVATASWHNPLVKVWDAGSGDLVRTWHMPGRTVAAFSLDGRWLATSTSEYQLWEVGSWQPKGPARPGHPIFNWNFTAFSPDGRVMARTSDGNKIQLLETSTEKPLAVLEAPGSITILRFQFSPDGSHLAAMQMDQQVQLWDLRLIRQELAQMRLDWDLPPYLPVEKGAAGPVTLEIEPEPASQTPAP
jgi:WD40 repeat protein